MCLLLFGFLLHRCWRRSQQRKLWKTGPQLSWTPWNTETGWEKTTEGTVWQRGQYNSVFDWGRQCCRVDACRCVCCCCFHPRHVCGCSWWRSSGRAWSWRRCRSSRSTHCPPSSASHPLRCWCRTYELASSSYAKSWWETRLSFRNQAKHEIWCDNQDLKAFSMAVSVPRKQ